MTQLKSSQACGFLVVRISPMNMDSAGRGVYPAQAPCLGSIYYGGIDRMPWFDIDEEFYSGILPADIEQMRKLVKESNPDLTGIELCKDLAIAVALLDYSNRFRLANELISIRSEKLADIKGTIELNDIQVSWIGYDILLLGDLSLLREGLFTSPSSFPGWEEAINEFGLFSSATHTEEYVRAYQIASLQGAVEQLPDTMDALDVVEVGRVNRPFIAASDSSS